MDESIIFVCLILLTLYGYSIKYINNGRHKVESNSDIQNKEIELKNYIGSKILLVGETGLFSLLLSIVLQSFKFYLISIWAFISFFIIIQAFHTAEKLSRLK